MDVGPEEQMEETKAVIVWSGDASHGSRPAAPTAAHLCFEALQENETNTRIISSPDTTCRVTGNNNLHLRLPASA